MGVVTPTVAMTARAAESLQRLRSILGDTIDVALLARTDQPALGQLIIQFVSLDAAEKMSDRTAQAIEEAGFQIEGDMPILTRNIPSR